MIEITSSLLKQLRCGLHHPYEWLQSLLLFLFWSSHYSYSYWCRWPIKATHQELHGGALVDMKLVLHQTKTGKHFTSNLLSQQGYMHSWAELQLPLNWATKPCGYGIELLTEACLILQCSGLREETFKTFFCFQLSLWRIIVHVTSLTKIPARMLSLSYLNNEFVRFNAAFTKSGFYWSRATVWPWVDI